MVMVKAWPVSFRPDRAAAGKAKGSNQNLMKVGRFVLVDMTILSYLAAGRDLLSALRLLTLIWYLRISSQNARRFLCAACAALVILP